MSPVAMERSGVRPRRPDELAPCDRAGVSGKPAPTAPTAPRGQTVPSAEAAPSLFEGLGGELTLDALIAGVWEELVAHRAVACPVCGGELAPDYGVHALPIGGRCRGCGSTLS